MLPLRRFTARGSVTPKQSRHDDDDDDDDDRADRRYRSWRTHRA